MNIKTFEFCLQWFIPVNVFSFFLCYRYSTAKTIAEDSEGVFKCGFAVAPVTDWNYYHSIYTERYMLQPNENPVRNQSLEANNFLQSSTPLNKMLHFFLI